MPNSIEIFENTLLQLITRQGTDNDRTEVILKSGELGYTTDNMRLFVGDGSTLGGNVVGHKFRGQTSNLTSLGSGLVGDIAYNIDDNSIYVIITGDGTTISDWKKIGGVYTAADGSINISIDNKISVLSLSAGTLSHDLIGRSIILDSSKRLSLSSTIVTDSIKTQPNTQYLKLPEYLNINSVNYSFPIGELGNNKYLKTDAIGRLSWSALGSNVNYFTYNSGGILPVGTIISTLTSTSLNQDWVICNGQLLAGVNYPELSAVIGTTYGGNNINFNVPNLNNRMLYGTISNPNNSTTYSFVSGTSAISPLSSIGVNFFIKAKPDKVIKGTLKVDSPLNITINGSNANDTLIPALTTLDSDVSISLPESRIKANYPLGLIKDSVNQTGSFVSIFDGDLELNGPTNTLKVDTPLKLTVNGVDKTNQSISPYDGNLNIQLNVKNTIKANAPLILTVNGSNKTGEIISLDTPNQNIVVDVDTSSIIKTIYPVGSVIFSADNINPSGRFGGTWVQISQGRFIAGVGTGNDGIQNKTITAGNNAGEYEHKLTVAEMPSHNHGGVVRYPRASRNPYTEQNQVGRPEDYMAYRQETDATGGNAYHNNTPPGFGLYVWQKTA